MASIMHIQYGSAMEELRQGDVNKLRKILSNVRVAVELGPRKPAQDPVLRYHLRLASER
jgi:hypothetical protein